MAVYVQPSLIAAAELGNARTLPENHARIGWRRYPILTASSSDPDYPVFNLNNYFSYSPWRPTAISAWVSTFIVAGAEYLCDYVGIAAHNLGSKGCTFKIQGTTNNSTWVDISENITPEDDSTIMVLFGMQSFAGYRLLISSGGVPTIGQVFFGYSTQMYRPAWGGIDPIDLSYDDKHYPMSSVGGQFLGKMIVAGGVRATVSWKDLPKDWVRDSVVRYEYGYGDVAGFVKHARTKPFFIAQNPRLHPDSAAFCRCPGNPKPPTPSGTRDLCDWSLSMEGLASDFAA